MLVPAVTLIVGVIAGAIALLQWMLARRKLSLDLFDRRYKVYDATRRFLSVIVRDADFKNTDLFEFYGGTSDAEFLFGSDVVAYLAEVRKHAVDMRTATHKFTALPVGDERSKYVDVSHQHLSWLSDQLGDMKRPFLPYLSFANIK